MAEDKPVVEVVCGVPVVTAPREIDISNAAGLRIALLAASARGHGTFVADLSRTWFCDSAGIRVLVRAHKRSQAEREEMLLVAPAAPVLRVFAVTGIDRLIPSFPTLQEAVSRAGAVPSARLRPARTGPEPGPVPLPRLVPGSTTGAGLPIGGMA